MTDPLFREVLYIVLSTTIPIVAAFASAGLRKWADRQGMAADDSRRQVLETAIQNGLARAEGLAEARLIGRDELVAETVSYVTKTATDPLKGLNISLEELRHSVEGRAAKKTQQGAPTAVVEVKS